MAADRGQGRHVVNLAGGLRPNAGNQPRRNPAFWQLLLPQGMSCQPRKDLTLQAHTTSRAEPPADDRDIP